MAVQSYIFKHNKTSNAAYELVENSPYMQFFRIWCSVLPFQILKKHNSNKHDLHDWIRGWE